MDNTNKPWSSWMADSVMARRESLTDKWSYDYGVILKGIEEVYYKTGDKKYFDYIEKTMDFFVEDDGNIKMYKHSEYNIDHINNGKQILFMYNQTGKEKYKKAAQLLMSQLETHPRTSEGAFWHKKIYPFQIWLDGLYMGSPFYAQYIRDIAKSDDFSDVIKQFFLCFKHTYNKETCLLHHAWDESREQFWCDKETGLSHNYWGRSIGWYAMALTDVLDYIPENHADRPKLIEILQTVVDGMLKYKDTESSVWYQVVDQKDRKGNYKEASVSCMMVSAMAKGVLKGYLDKDKYLEIIKKCYDGIIDEFVTVTNLGLVNLNKVCQVGGLGGGKSQVRDGSFAYYISEPIITNDPKGVGAFIMASVYVEKLS